MTSFGGPIAHLGYFRDEYVVRRRWVDDATYADLVALCQLLPGPASSQLGIAIGTLRAGRLGGLAAWLGFTLPSAVALVAFAYGVRGLADQDAGWLAGLKLAAVAVVALAVVGMGRRLTPDLPRAALALAAAAVALAWEGTAGQVVPIAAAAVVGVSLLGAPRDVGAPALRVPIGRREGVAALAAFACLLALLPALRATVDSQPLAVADSFYRAGALVFGGGHVVLPLLEAEVVPPGWVSESAFVAGYGAAQAVPGPLFTFAAYLGAVLEPEPDGVAGAALATAAIFLPSFLLVGGLLPFWELLRRRPRVRSALVGVNAAVVGLVLAALYDPVGTSAVGSVGDAAFAAGLVGILAAGVPAWLVVALAAGAGAALL